MIFIHMAPYLKIGIHGTPFGEVTWNHTPLATTFENVQHTTKHLIKINGSRTCLATCLLEHKLDSAKLFTTDVAWIVFARHDEILGKYTAYLRLTNPNLDYEQALRKGKLVVAAVMRKLIHIIDGVLKNQKKGRF